jgi:hypothetical protein
MIERSGDTEVKNRILALLKEKKRASGPTITSNVGECTSKSDRYVRYNLDQLVSEGRVGVEVKEKGFEIFFEKRAR